MIEPNRKLFSADPFGYSALAWQKWAMAQSLAGFVVDPETPPTSAELKSPVLWLAHANALSEAAKAMLDKEPTWESMPVLLRGVCDTQYCAVALMLVGYSLETCLKAMLIMKVGIEAYAAEEKRYLHHRLEDLASFIPEFDEKDKAILRALTHFTMWAGRYPDPGTGREGNAKQIFAESENHQIAGRDLFGLATRVMKYSQEIIDATE